MPDAPDVFPLVDSLPEEALLRLAGERLAALASAHGLTVRPAPRDYRSLAANMTPIKLDERRKTVAASIERSTTALYVPHGSDLTEELVAAEVKHCRAATRHSLIAEVSDDIAKMTRAWSSRRSRFTPPRHLAGEVEQLLTLKVRSIETRAVCYVAPWALRRSSTLAHSTIVERSPGNPRQLVVDHLLDVIRRVQAGAVETRSERAFQSDVLKPALATLTQNLDDELRLANDEGAAVTARAFALEQLAQLRQELSVLQDIPTEVRSAWAETLKTVAREGLIPLRLIDTGSLDDAEFDQYVQQLADAGGPNTGRTQALVDR